MEIMKKFEYYTALNLLVEFLRKEYPEFADNPEFMACVTHLLHNPQIKPPGMSKEIYEKSLSFFEKRNHTYQMSEWQDIPFIDYLNAVDDILEIQGNQTSTQKELEPIAFLHEDNTSPQSAAFEVLKLRQNK